MAAKENMPTLAVRGTQPDYRRVYKWLRQEWRQRTGQSYVDLASHLKTTRQLVSLWATGNGGASQPPMWALQWLCWQLGMVLVISPDGVKLVKDNQSTKHLKPVSPKPGDAPAETEPE